MSDPVVVDIETTVKTEVAKALAAAKAEPSVVVTAIKTFIAAHYSKVVGVGVGYAAAHFHIIEAAFKLI